jgi:hypothetical protein
MASKRQASSLVELFDGLLDHRIVMAWGAPEAITLQVY